MGKSIIVKQKKRGRPKTGQMPFVGIRLSLPLQDAINQVLRDSSRPCSNTSEAIRFIVRDWLVEHGYLKGE
jgi:hypothetical protein